MRAVQKYAELLRYVGRRVVVELERDHVVTGVLTSVSEDGDVVVDSDEGVRYCWPALTIRPESPA